MENMWKITRVKETSSYTVREFHTFWTNSFREKKMWGITFWATLVSDQNNGYFTWRPIYICNHVSLKFSLYEELFQTKVVEKIKIHILCSITSSFFLKSCRLWGNVENIVRSDRPQITIWHIACWIPKATNTSRILIAFPRQQLSFRVSSVGGMAVNMTERDCTYLKLWTDGRTSWAAWDVSLW